MKFFFYFPILLAGITYIYNALSGNSGYSAFNRITKRLKREGANSTTAGNQGWKELTDTEKGSFGWFLGGVLTSLLFSVIGLLSFNWVIFALYLFNGLLFSRVLGKLQMTRLSWLISGTLLVFAVLNSYHFQIDMFEYIKSLF